MPMIAPIIQSAMTSPLKVELTPEPGSVDADIDGVAITWRPSQDYDPIDSAEFEIFRAGVSYTVVATNIGSGRWRAFADVGLFPLDENVEIKAVAVSSKGRRGVAVWSFTCRDGLGDITAAGEVNTLVERSAAGLAETQSDFGSTSPAVADIASDYGQGATNPASLTLVEPERGEARANVSPFFQMGGVAHASNELAGLFADAQAAEHFTVDFLDTAESTLARFHYVRAFTLAALNSLSDGRSRIVESRSTETVEGYVKTKIWPNASRVGGETVGHGLTCSLDNYRAKLSPGSGSATSGEPTSSPSLNSNEAITGSGVEVLFDIDDATLDGLMDE